MFAIIKKFFRRKYVKYLINVRYRKSVPDGNLEINQNERICKSICYKLINQPDSKFLIAPISGKRYIKNSRLELFVILDDKRISITNHVYHYDVFFTDRDFDRITKMYDNKTETIRQEFENEMKSQIHTSLSTILHRLNED
jgi:hypothetical protein